MDILNCKECEHVDIDKGYSDKEFYMCYEDKCDKFYDIVMSHDYIFTLVYHPIISLYGIKTSELKWFNDGCGFYYEDHLFGYEDFSPMTYGKTWAFTKEEMDSILWGNV